MEVQECSGAPRERTPLALAQLREPAKLCQEWLHPIEVFLSRMPHLPSMTLSAQAPVAATPEGPGANALSHGASQRISSTERGLSIYAAGLRIGGEGPREAGQTEANGKIIAEEKPP